MMVPGIFGDPSGASRWLPLAIGGAFALTAAAAFLTARDALVTFDQGARAVSIVRRSTLKKSARVYPWRHVEDVTLEKMDVRLITSGQTVQAYRAVLVLRGEKRIRWFSGHGSDTQAVACIAAARAFGGWQALPPADLPERARARSASISPRQRALVSVPIILMGVGLGVHDAWVQGTRLLRWRPVDAAVTHSDVEVVHGEKSSWYRPVVSYRYVDEAGAHDALGVTMLDRSYGRSWARAVVHRYPVGTEVSAYVDPANPQRGFLDRRID